MRFLAEDLSDSLGRRVVDQTGLTGRYDFSLTWTPDNSAQAVNGSSGSGQVLGPSLFTAIEEQLGLRLVPVKAPVDVVVIDHIERPSVN
jgi:bla regulator protein blaR1